MPQLIAPDFLPQLFWLAVSFIVLYVLMSRIAMPRVARAIDLRRGQLDADLARAGEVRAEAETVLAEYQAALSEARTEAQATLRRTGETLAAEAAERQRALAGELAQQIEAAEQRIAGLKREALAEVRGIAAEVGRALVEKLTGAPPDAARLAAAVEQAVGERVA